MERNIPGARRFKAYGGPPRRRRFSASVCLPSSAGVNLQGYTCLRRSLAPDIRLENTYTGGVELDDRTVSVGASPLIGESIEPQVESGGMIM